VEVRCAEAVVWWALLRRVEPAGQQLSSRARGPPPNLCQREGVCDSQVSV
jgi:hypothetical protein